MLTWQLMWRRAAAAFCEQQRPHSQGLRPAQHAPHVNHHMPRGRQLCGAVTGRQLPGLRWGLRCHSPLPGRPNRSGGPASDAPVSLNMGSPNLSVSVVSLAVGFATCQLWPRGVYGMFFTIHNTCLAKPSEDHLPCCEARCQRHDDKRKFHCWT